jgi:hypothetical protein
MQDENDPTATEHDDMKQRLQAVWGYDEDWHHLADAHESEANSKGATINNFGWGTAVDSITSKTSCGILTSYRYRGNVKHDWSR